VVQLDPVIAALNILLVLVLVLVLEILRKTEDENEDEDEEEGPNSAFSPPVNNGVKRHPPGWLGWMSDCFPEHRAVKLQFTTHLL
jgi:hypothetical protein